MFYTHNLEISVVVMVVVNSSRKVGGREGGESGRGGKLS